MYGQCVTLQKRVHAAIATPGNGSAHVAQSCLSVQACTLLNRNCLVAVALCIMQDVMAALIGLACDGIVNMSCAYQLGGRAGMT